jgi:hypothetical protein
MKIMKIPSSDNQIPGPNRLAPEVFADVTAKSK